MFKTAIDANLEITTSKKDLAFGSKKKDKRDIIETAFKVVHAGLNKRGDIYSEEEIKSKWDTLVNKPINWEHMDDSVIGVVTESALKSATASEPLYISGKGIIWKLKQPDLTELILESATKGGSLSVSIEAWFADANYHLMDPITKETKEVLDSTTASMDIKEAWGSEVELGKQRYYVGRELVDVVFGGCAITATPADRYAMLLAAASNKDGDTERYPHLSDSDFAWPVKRIFPVNTKLHTEASLSQFNDVVSKYDLTGEQITTIHDRVTSAASKFAIASNVLHDCTLCSKGGTESMADKEPTVNLEEETVETPEAVEEASASEEDAAVENTAEESTESTEAEEATPEASEEAEASEEIDVKAALSSIDASLKKLVEMAQPRENEAEASVDENELTPVEAENEKLKETVAGLEKFRTDFSGLKRVNELAKAGISVDETDEKITWLGKMSDEEYVTFKEATTKAINAAKASLEDEQPEDDKAVASILNRESETEEVNVASAYSKIYT